MTKKAFAGLFLCALAGALVLRLARPEARPVHPDEANQAVKFGALLERGDYRFDPRDHHGPTLYYLTLPAARLAGARTLAGLDMAALRAVPALAGAAVLLLLLLLAGGLSREAVLAAAALAAVSPAMVYYSRFYIQETLLVAFLAALIGAGWRYAKTRSARWALAAGAAAGLMAATKETSALLFAAAAAALAATALAEKAYARPGGRTAADGSWTWRGGRNGLPRPGHAVLALAAGAAVAALFYSSFFTNPGGLADAVRALGLSLERAGHPGVHAHPWHYYFGLLAYAKGASGPVWSEAFLLFLALAGGIGALAPDGGRDDSPRFLRFTLFFTVFTAAAYSLVPYKTPWNLLPFYFGLVLLAGHGVALLLRISRSRLVKLAVLALLVPGFAGLAAQSYRASFARPADPANPYAYAQTVPDLLRLVREVERAAAAAPEGKDLLVAVVAPPDETWPLPWYLRDYGRAGYWTSPAAAREGLGEARPAVVVSSAAFAEEVGAALGADYRMSFYGLRPEVVLALFVRGGRP